MNRKLHVIAFLLVLVFVVAGCARAISMHQAANGKKPNCGRAYIGRN